MSFNENCSINSLVLAIQVMTVRMRSVREHQIGIETFPALRNQRGVD